MARLRPQPRLAPAEARLVDRIALGKMEDDVSIALAPSAGQGRGGKERKTRISKRGRLGEGRPTTRTPEVGAKIAEDGTEEAANEFWQRRRQSGKSPLRDMLYICKFDPFRTGKRIYVTPSAKTSCFHRNNG